MKCLRSKKRRSVLRVNVVITANFGLNTRASSRAERTLSPPKIRKLWISASDGRLFDEIHLM
ncbi:hypothetical protein CCMA1212_001967 [Trichoderma ghanense]|uniref:Uncharacterized protein n=1 Tax=Trichoderma ghanense TaxID=65468 RepID=A0ABY2HCP2_9HYPO